MYSAIRTLGALVVLTVLTACAPQPDAMKPVPPDGARVLARQLDADFARIRTDIEQLAARIAPLYDQPDESFAGVDRSKYAFAANGAFYKTKDDGGAALWISAAVPVTDAVTRVAYMTEAVDPWLIEICKLRPEVSQAYYNDRHSLNRIYPWFDTIAQYPARMNIPEYNFYYLADAEHNPARRGVWVNEPYVDPAGRGWMVSAIAPVYAKGRLEGVPGLDVTIASIVGRYLVDDQRAIAVISSQGVLVAATESAIQHLEMPPLKSHKYLETVKLDTFQPDEYNILKSTVRTVRSLARDVMTGPDDGELHVELAGTAHTVRHAKVKELGWWVLEMDPP